MKKYILTILIAVISTTAFSQTSYYVATTGNDSANGSLTTPWKTIQHGCFQLSAGDTLNILGGTYPEKFYLDVSGTSGQIITIRAYQNQNVIVDADSFSTSTPIFYAGNQSYYRLEGIHFTNCYHSSGVGLFINGFGQNIEIINCKFSNIAIDRDPDFPVNNNTNQPTIYIVGDTGTDAISNVLVSGIEIFNCRPGYSECLSLGGNVTDFQLSNNHIHHNTNIAIDATGNYQECPVPALDHPRNGVINNNHCHDNPSAYSTSAGIYIDGGYDIIIENNILHHNDYGIEIGCEETGNTKNIIARNNLIYLNKSAGISLGGYDASTGGYVENSKVLNNTFYHNDTDQDGNGELLFTQFENGEISNNIFYVSSQNYLMSNDLNQPNLTMEYNLVYSDAGQANVEAYWNGNDLMGLTSIYSTIGVGNNSNYENPLFIDASNFDFHIASNSPAVDAGNPLYVAAPNEVDMDNELRVYNNIIDCGTDEYGSVVGINDFTDSEIIVYPNPTTEKINLPLKLENPNYTIFSIYGQPVQHGVISSNTIDIATLNNGIYLVKIINKTPKNNYSFKVIKK